MMLGLVWIVGCYTAGVVILHLLHWQWKKKRSDRTVHYVLRTFNNQLQLEWYIRSLSFFSWIKGRTIRITIADEGSTDDTMAIAQRLSREHHLDISTDASLDWDAWIRQHDEEQVVAVRISHSEMETAFKYL
ncbi:hypothetical protein PAESOLCIP111_03528 [Paenibacillus solanacearum]|uniref:Uncharacterized protein n=1 Tax=Paenibacillus solanacearum TaxID=2048548 RepID=A0A916NR02_9BACL|nr:hypothetical protein [Paenibacillus solanacearum]CAG7634069.1 hypothetical protein PAESOLCIP111_03528 [Paenibacillus solanacearum]